MEDKDLESTPEELEPLTVTLPARVVWDAWTILGMVTELPMQARPYGKMLAKMEDALEAVILEARAAKNGDGVEEN